VALLRYLANAPSLAMTHWKQDSAAADLLAGLLANDTP
jgi:hypothetical protein